MSSLDRDQYKVFGNPIAQSRSPDIHMAFAQQTGQALDYDKQLVEVDGFAEAAEDFFRSGGKGLNITSPFKADAFVFASDLTERARVAGAVNTLIKQDNGAILGDNTDGVGMITDMTQRLGWPMRDKKVLLLGAGGAARGVLLPCLQQHPVSLTVANRTAAKAEKLADAFAPYGAVEACGFTDLEGQHFDVVINATSAGLHGELPPIPVSLFGAGTAVYDMTYAAKPTPFLEWVQAQGAGNWSDGLGMLVGQAAESFFMWRGVRPEIEPVLKMLRESMEKISA